MNNTLSHEEREALKQDFFASLHCALPGIVESHEAVPPDPQKQGCSQGNMKHGGNQLIHAD